MRQKVLLISVVTLFVACSETQSPEIADSTAQYDILIRGGTIYDGSGGQSFTDDVAIVGDRIVDIGDLNGAVAEVEVDASGLAVSPGFVNMLSWAVSSLIEDGRGMSDIRQGVTLEVFGEGWSWGPWTDDMKAERVARQGDIKYDIEWTTLNEYLEFITTRGISPNVASFIAASTPALPELRDGPHSQLRVFVPWLRQ